MVNLDKDKIRPPREGAPPNTVRVILRMTKQINMSVLSYYLEGKIQFDNSVLEAISMQLLSLLSLLCLKF